VAPNTSVGLMLTRTRLRYPVYRHSPEFAYAMRVIFSLLPGFIATPASDGRVGW
jgi:hypothetical protein